MNDIKARMKSVQSTMQITKAMELVATSKLRRAKEKVERSRPFYEILADAINNIESSADAQDSVWNRAPSGKKTLYIVIAGDRGLAGGYNANVFRMTEALSKDENSIFLPIGKKALEYYKHRNYSLFSESFEYTADVGVGDSLAIAEAVCEAFLKGDVDRVRLVYTKFVSMISQLPVYEELLPLDREKNQKSGKFIITDPIYEGEIEEVLSKIVPDYVGGIIYSSVCEALASESGARRMAMNSANKNAEEIIGSLMLHYNRARQAAITQEITEIVSGAEAL